MLEVSSSLQLLWGSGAIAGPIVAGLLMQFTTPRRIVALHGRLGSASRHFRSLSNEGRTACPGYEPD